MAVRKRKPPTTIDELDKEQRELIIKRVESLLRRSKWLDDVVHGRATFKRVRVKGHDVPKHHIPAHWRYVKSK